MTEVTIVIPNYNGEKFLDTCLSSLIRNTSCPIKIVVVDNGSTDESKKVIAGYPQVELVALNKNYGFCRAVNIGIKNTKTPYLILLNNDVEVKEGFVEALLSKIKTNEDIFSVEPLMIQFYNREKVDSAGTFYNILGWANARGKDKDFRKYLKGRESFSTCAGASIYRRAIFEEIGYFDESHFAYLEDVDIGYRARIYGYKNYYEPKSIVYHVGSGATGSRHNAFKVKISARNNVWLIYKNMPVIQLLLNLPFLLMGTLIKCLYFFKKGLAKDYVKGICSGIMALKNTKKVKYSKHHLRNYLKIEAALLYNLFLIVLQ